MHELRLRLPAGGIEAFTFRRLGSEEPIGMREGDTLIIAHSLRDEITEELLFIANQTRGAQLNFSDPGASAAGTATALAIGLGAIIALGAGTNGASVPVSLLIFALVAAPSRFFLGRAYAPRHSLDAGRLAELGARQSWLGKKAQMLRLRERAAADAGEKQLMRDQLQQLREKMTSVDSAAYVDRLATIKRAPAALEHSTCCSCSSRSVSFASMRPSNPRSSSSLASPDSYSMCIILMLRS